MILVGMVTVLLAFVVGYFVGLASGRREGERAEHLLDVDRVARKMEFEEQQTKLDRSIARLEAANESREYLLNKELDLEARRAGSPFR